MLSLPGLEIYPSKRKVFRDRQEIQLTTKEYEILLLLAANKGRVLTYSQIYEKVWGDLASGSENNTIGFHICNLREKLYQATPNAPFTIRSVREVGYCFEIQAREIRVSSLIHSGCCSSFFCCKSLLQWQVHLLLSSCQVPPFTKRAQLPLVEGGIYTVTVSGSEKADYSYRPWHGTFAQ